MSIISFSLPSDDIELGIVLLYDVSRSHIPVHFLSFIKSLQFSSPIRILIHLRDGIIPYPSIINFIPVRISLILGQYLLMILPFIFLLFLFHFLPIPSILLSLHPLIQPRIIESILFCAIMFSFDSIINIMIFIKSLFFSILGICTRNMESRL